MEKKQLIAILLIASLAFASATSGNDVDDCGWTWKDYAYMAGGSVIAVAAAPVVVGAAGFGAAGIGAGTLAANAMSMATTYGVGGGAVATLQSIGAAGLGVAGTIVTGSAGAAAGKIVKDVVDGKKKDD